MVMPKALAAIVASGLVVAASAAASAVRSDPGAVLLPNGTEITSASSSNRATLTVTGHTTVSCGSTLSMTLGVNGTFPVVATVAGLGFDGCSDTSTAARITNCHLVAPLPSALITSTMFTQTVAVTAFTSRCTLAGTSAGCYYAVPRALGVFNSLTSTLPLTSSTLTHDVPAGVTDDTGSACGSSGSLAVELLDVHRPGGTTLTITPT